MKEILILSGKGGTGKTSLSGCFAQLSANAVFCDCDVDASNLHLLLAPEIIESHDFYAGWSPLFIPEKCTACGKCSQICRFQAILPGESPRQQHGLCEGCGVCVDFCPANAIELHPRHCGKWYHSRTAYGSLFHAELFPGEENSGKLIAELRKAARMEAEKQSADHILSDGPPGIGCPVISSMSGTDMVIVVTEPTPSGIHDLKRVAELTRQFEVPAKVIINKWDLNPDLCREIADFCKKYHFDEIGRISYDPLFPSLLREGKTVLSIPDSLPAQQIKNIWHIINTSII